MKRRRGWNGDWMYIMISEKWDFHPFFTDFMHADVSKCDGKHAHTISTHTQDSKSNPADFSHSYQHHYETLTVSRLNKKFSFWLPRTTTRNEDF